MALQYDYTTISTEGWSKQDHDLAANFCWTMSFIDQREITEKNKTEIMFRIQFLQKLGMGPWTHTQPLKEVKKMVNRLIGYKTNVGELSTKKFMNRWLNAKKERIMDQVLKEATDAK